MFKVCLRSILAASLSLGAVVVSFNATAETREEQMQKAADKARESFSLIDLGSEGVHQAAMRAEYVYLMTLYTDILAARALGDVADTVVEFLGAPEFVQQFAEKGVNTVVLWSPAALAAVNEYNKRFARLTYIVPQSRAFAKETIGFLNSYRNHVKMNNQAITVNLPELLKASGRYTVKVAKIGAATVANYGLVAGAFYLSKDAMSYTLASRETLVAAKEEIALRLAELRKELPEAAYLDGLIFGHN